MSSFFSHLQNIPNTWWQLARLPQWTSGFPNPLNEFYRHEQIGIQRMNELLEMATRIRKSFLEGFFKNFQPARPAKAPAGTTVEQMPDPASQDCHLPGG